MSSPSKRSSSEDFSQSSSKRAATARVMGRDGEDDSRVYCAASRSTRDYIDCLDSILHANSDANASEELLGTLQELEQMDANLQSMKGKLREMRVSAAQELLEQALLYQPTLREALADAQTELAATAAALSASVSAAFSELEATDLALAALGETPSDPPSYSGGDQASGADSISSTASDPEAIATETGASTVAYVGSEQSIELESPSIAGHYSTAEFVIISAVSDHPAKSVVLDCVSSTLATEKEIVSAATTSHGAEPSTTGMESFNITREVASAAGTVSTVPTDLKVAKSDNLNASQPSCLDNRKSLSSDGVSVLLSSTDTISCSRSTSSSKEQIIRVEPSKVCSSVSLVNEAVAVHEYVGSVTCDVKSAGVAGLAPLMHEEQSASSQNRSEFMNDNASKESQILISRTQEIYEPIEAMEVDDNATHQNLLEADLSDCQTRNDSHLKNIESQEIQHRSGFRDCLNLTQEEPNHLPFLSDEMSNNSDGEKSTASEAVKESGLGSEIASSNALVESPDIEVAPEFQIPVLAECNSGSTMSPVQGILPDGTPNEQPAGLLSGNSSTEVIMNEKEYSSAEQSAGTLQGNELLPQNVATQANATFHQNAHAMQEENVSSREDNAVTERRVEYSATSLIIDQQRMAENNNPQLEQLQQQASINVEQRGSGEMDSDELPSISVSGQDCKDTSTEESATPREPLNCEKDARHIVMDDSLTPAIHAAVTDDGQIVTTTCQLPLVEGTSGFSEVYESAAGNYFAGVAETTSMKPQIAVIVNEGIECYSENKGRNNIAVKTILNDQLENVGQSQMSVQQEFDSDVQLNADHFQQQEGVLGNLETPVQPQSTFLDTQADPLPEETDSALQEPADDAPLIVDVCSQINPAILEESEASSTTQSDRHLPSNKPLSHSGGQSMQRRSSFVLNVSDVAPEFESMEVSQEAIRQTMCTSPLPAPTVQEKPPVVQSLDSRETSTSDRHQDSMSPSVTQQLLALLQTFANSSSVTSSAGPTSSLVPNIMNPELTQALIIQMQGALAGHQSLVAPSVTTDTSQTDALPLQNPASENVNNTKNK